MDPIDPQTMAQSALNLCVIFDHADTVFLIDALEKQPYNLSSALIITGDQAFLADLPRQTRLDYHQTGLDSVPISFTDVSAHIRTALTDLDRVSAVIVDMRWGAQTVAAAANFERWGGFCDRLTRDANVPVVSIYSRSLMIEDQLIAAMRGHSHFLAPSGIYGNPFWLPPEYQSGATISQQIGFVLGRLVPDYQGLLEADKVDDGAASGSDPQWISSPRRLRPRVGKDEIWKIRCFGRMRIYLSDGSQVKWDIPGSAPKKTKALFAYLLQCGERGAPTDQLSQLLWPDEPDEVKTRKRLHHAIAMLRRTLGGREYVLRSGDYYTLAPPAGTWIDISSFEQSCNRAKVLAKAGKSEEAIMLLEAAERLYSGELFEDLSPTYFENDLENWVVPKRIWFRDMALKVLRDKAAIHRQSGNFRVAIEACQKALKLDPTCEIAHAEAMHVFHAQSRSDAIARQFRQYVDAMAALGAQAETQDLETLKGQLMQSLG